MTSLSFNLMNQASNSAFQQIVNEMHHTELKCKSAARLFKLNVVSPRNFSKVYNFTTNFILNEAPLFPSVQSIYWGDQSGNFILSQKQSNGIMSEIIDRSKYPFTNKIIYADNQGKILRILSSTDLHYDPRERPWYHAAEKTKQTTWLGVYRDGISHLLGMSVATPVYDDQNKLLGIVSVNIRLDYLRHLVENIHLSEQSVLFIVTSNGNLLAYPGLVQYKNKILKDIYTLTSAPWVSKSFDIYKKTGKPEFKFEYNHNIYLATYRPASHYGSYDWLIGAIVPVNDLIGPLRKTQIITALVSLGILIIGISLVSGLISAVVRPLRKITDEIEKIQHFDLTETPPIHSRIKEISSMANALYAMKNGLRSFQKYVPSALVRQLVESGEDARIGGVTKTIAILFSDISNFTTITEQTEPKLLTRHLCDYFDELSTQIIAARGTIDKYIGDAIMAFWGAPLPEEQSAQQAAIAAINCVKRLRELNTQWALEGKPVLLTRIGLHLGDAIVGNLGSSERLNYTAIGDSINITSRLENINKLYGTQIIISETVYHAVKNKFITRMLDRVTLKGKSKPHYIYELIADDRDQLTYDLDSYTQLFSKGFNAYQATAWNEAIYYFSECLKIYPSDSVAPLFINRCRKFKLNRVSEQWDGIWP